VGVITGIFYFIAILIIVNIFTYYFNSINGDILLNILMYLFPIFTIFYQMIRKQPERTVFLISMSLSAIIFMNWFIYEWNNSNWMF